MRAVTPEALIAQARKVEQKGDAYADYVHQKKMMDLWEKHFMAALKIELKEEYLIKEVKITESELESRARSSVKYKEYITAQIKKLKFAGRAHIEYETAKTMFSAMQSALSAEKQQWTTSKVS